MSLESNWAKKCGCNLRDASGNLMTRSMAALAYETNRIQSFGYETLPERDTLLDGMIPKRAVNVGEGESPRSIVRFRFGLPNHDYATSEFFTSGASTENVIVDGPLGRQIISTSVKNNGSAGCDNRSVKMLAGRDEFGKTTVMLPDIETECSCILDYARVEQFGPYLAGLRESMPMEAALMKEHALFRQTLALSKNVTVEGGNNAPTFTPGRFPYLPSGGPQVNTFKAIHQHLTLQGHSGKLKVPISATALQSMMIAYYQQFGIGMQVNQWAQGQFPLDSNNVYTHEGLIDFQVIDLPVVGYFKEVATNRVEFFPLSTRSWRAGTGGGITYDGNTSYLDTEVVIDGSTYPLFEVVPIHGSFRGSKAPFYQEGVGMAGSTEKAALKAAMWSGTQVRNIGGAFIPNNEKEQKWFTQLSQAYTLGSDYPEMGSFIAWRRQYYTFSENLIGLTVDKLAASSSTIAINGGRQGLATSSADVTAALDPTQPGPDAYTGGCGESANSAGKIRAACALVVDEDASTITVTAERIDGDNGIASVAYAVNDGTGVASTDYTDTSGTLTWAAGVYGVKSFTITIPATARHGKTFSVAWSSFTGASNVTNGCTTTNITIKRNAKNYRLADGLNGEISAIVADGGDWLTGTFAGDADGAQALETAINALLAGDGVAEVTFGTDWNIEIVGTHVLFDSAEDDGPDSKDFSTF